MKNRLINTILALSVLVGVSGCNGFFESLPGPQLDLEDTFTDQYRTEGFLKNVYSHLPDDVTGEYKYSEVSDRYGGFWGVGSLEAQYSQGGGWDGNATQYANTWNRGAVSAMDSEIDFWWGHYYKGIAKAGVFIANVDKCVVLSERVRTLYKAEARALRAVFYWYILRQYGPCVLTGETAMAIDSPVSELLLPRSTVDDCVDYIVSELDFAAEVFKDNGRMILGGTDAQFGRLDRGQCKALKAKVLLYAASPLFNGNTLMSSMKNDDGTRGEFRLWHSSRIFGESCRLPLDTALRFRRMGHLQFCQDKFYRKRLFDPSILINCPPSAAVSTSDSQSENRGSSPLGDASLQDVHSPPTARSLGGLGVIRRIFLDFSDTGATVKTQIPRPPAFPPIGAPPAHCIDFRGGYQRKRKTS